MGQANRLRMYRYLMRMRPTIVVDIIKRVFRFGRIEFQSDTGTFWIDPISHMGQGIINGFEEDTHALIKSLLKAGDTFVDVGANEGFYSIVAANIVGSEGSVIAIEPQKRLIEVIQKNVALNDFENISVVNAAMNDGTEEETSIWLSPSTNTGSSSVVNSYFISKPQKVKSKSLAAVFDECNVSYADLVKIDVEGFEFEVIKGATSLLEKRQIGYLLVDYHHPILLAQSIDPKDIHQRIIHYGYELEGTFSPFGYNLYYAPDVSSK